MDIGDVLTSVRDDTLRMVEACLHDNEALRKTVADMTADIDRYKHMLRCHHTTPASTRSPLAVKIDGYQRGYVAEVEAKWSDKCQLLQDRCKDLDTRLAECQATLDQERIVKAKILTDVSELAANEDRNKALADEYAAELRCQQTANKQLTDRLHRMEVELDGVRQRHAMELQVAREMADSRFDTVVPQTLAAEPHRSQADLYAMCMRECVDMLACMSDRLAAVVDDGLVTCDIAMRNASDSADAMRDRHEMNDACLLSIIDAYRHRVDDLQALVVDQSSTISDMQTMIDDMTYTYTGIVAGVEHRCDQMSMAVDLDANSRIMQMAKSFQAAEASSVHVQYVEQTTAKKERNKLVAEVERLMLELGDREALVDCMEDEIRSLKSRLTIEHNEAKASKARDHEFIQLKRQNKALISKLEQVYIDNTTIVKSSTDTPETVDVRQLTADMRSSRFEASDLRLEVEMLTNQLTYKCMLVKQLAHQLSGIDRLNDDDAAVDTQSKARLMKSNDRLRVDVKLFKDESSSKFSSGNWLDGDGRMKKINEKWTIRSDKN